MATSQIPNARVPVLKPDGSLTLPWRLWMQNLGQAASGAITGAVISFNTRVGAIVLQAADVIAALGFTPGQGTVTTTGAVTLGSPAVFTGATSIGVGSTGATFQVRASVALTAGQFVAFTSGGLILADATDATKPACGFVLSGAAIGQLVTVYGPGAVNSALSGLTVGAPYFLAGAGALTATVPATGASQFLGYAASATQLMFSPGPDMAL